MHLDHIKMSKEEICTHFADDYNRFLGAVATPIFQDSTFKHIEGSGYGGIGHYVYTMDNNPTTEIAEKKIAALEEGEDCVCFSSGMAAISSACMHYLSAGSHVIYLRNSYHSTKILISSYLERLGVKSTEVIGTSIDDFEMAVRPNTKLIMLESPATHLFCLQDIAAVVQLAKSRGIATVIDNSWATPMYMNPLSMGIDIVVHTASTYLGGHSDIIGGALISNKDVCDNIRGYGRSLFGACFDPQAAFLLIRGLRTLPVRMKVHMESGMAVATFLESHPKVRGVFYPGLESHPQHALAKSQMSGYSGLLSFTPRFSSLEKQTEFCDNLEHFIHGSSWGGYGSCVTSTTVWDNESEKVTGLPRGTLRLSIGLEKVETLMDSLDWALQKYCE